MPFVPRINSSQLGIPPRQGDPLASQRALNSATQIADQVSGELGRLDAKVSADLDRQANFFGQVESQRRARELSGDLAQVEQETSESGAGFSDAAMQRLGQRQQESLSRATNDRERKLLQRQFKLEAEQYRDRFDAGQRDWSRQYANFEYLRALDDTKQRVGRGVLVEPQGHGYNRFKSGLTHTESGGNARAHRTNKDGREFGGLHQMSQGRLDEAFVALGIPRLTVSQYKDTPEEFQNQIFDWHIADIDRHIQSEGLGAAIGTKINGVTVTHDGMRAVAHLGGKTGLSKFIRSGGRYHPSDELGTSLLDYLRTHGSDSYGVPNYNGPLPDLSKNEEFRDELTATFSIIDAMPVSSLEKKQLKQQAEAELTQVAVQSIAQDNPSAALALLRSGNLDGALGFDFTSGAEIQLAKEQRQQMEREIAIQAKAQAAQFKDDAIGQADDLIAFHRTGLGERPQALTSEQMGVLSREKRQAVLDAPHIASATNLAQVSDVGDLVTIRETIASGDSPRLVQKQIEAFDKQAEPRIVEAGAREHISQARAAGIVPNVANRDVKKAIDADFAQNVQSFSEVAGFVDEYGVIPDAFGDMVAQVIGGTNEDAKREAITAVAQLHAENPEKLAEVDSPAIALALTADHYQRLGLPQEEALRLGQEVNAPVNDSLNSARQKAWTQTDGRRGSASKADEAIELFKDEIADADGAAVPEDALGVYLQLMRDKFVASGDMNLSVTLAKNSFLKRYGVTYIGGERWQLNPPERAYAVYGDPEKDAFWIEEQAKESASRAFDDVQGVTLQAEPGQGRRDKPAYRMYVVNGDTLEDGGLFTPDPSGERERLSGFQVRGSEVDAMASDLALLRFREADLYQRERAIASKFVRLSRDKTRSRKDKAGLVEIHRERMTTQKERESVERSLKQLQKDLNKDLRTATGQPNLEDRAVRAARGAETAVRAFVEGNRVVFRRVFNGE